MTAKEALHQISVQSVYNGVTVQMRVTPECFRTIRDALQGMMDKDDHFSVRSAGKVCKKCMARVSDGQKYCGVCGTEVEE